MNGRLRHPAGRMERSRIAHAVLCSALFLLLVATAGCSTRPAPTPTAGPLEYHNSEYGFTFRLPASWKGYSVVVSNWTGTISDPQRGDVPALQGPLLYIRHPLWTQQVPRQDIPIMVFTRAQWDSLQRNDFLVSAAPIAPSELGRNANYVFALPPRFDYAFPTGWEEVEQIIAAHPLRTP